MADLSVDLIAIAKRIKLIMEMEKKLETRMRNLESRLNSQVDPGLPCGGMSNQLQFSHCYPVSVTSISSDHFWGAILTPTGSYGSNAFTTDTSLSPIRIEVSGVYPALNNRVLATFVGVAGSEFEAFYGAFPGPVWHWGTLLSTLTSVNTVSASITTQGGTVFVYPPKTMTNSEYVPSNAPVKLEYCSDDAKWYVTLTSCNS